MTETLLKLVDLGLDGNHKTIEDEALEDLVTSLVVSGFAQIVGHGIDPIILSKIIELEQVFFSAEEKYSCIADAGHRGYLTSGAVKMRGSLRADQKESYVFGFESQPGNDYCKLPKNNWPSINHPLFRQICLDTLNKFDALGTTILNHIGKKLGLSSMLANSALCKFTRGTLLHYPPSINEDSSMNLLKEYGVAPHTDYGFLTIVYQHIVGGLKVKVNNCWIDVPVVPESLVINIGDLLSRWTNGYLKSTLHMVSGNNIDRYSFAVFCDPDPEFIIKPESIDGRKLVFDEIKVRDYVASRQLESVSR